jgi:hypothetical protein
MRAFRERAAVAFERQNRKWIAFEDIVQVPPRS